MTSSNIKDNYIKDIPDVLPGILKAASAGKLVLFIGAGVSRVIGCPSWKKFALLQLKALLDKRAINYYEYKNLKLLDARKLLSICRRIYEEKDIQPPNMKSLLKGIDDLINKFKIYENLYAFNAVYVTTNYDDYMDQAAEKPKEKQVSSKWGQVLQYHILISTFLRFPLVVRYISGVNSIFKRVFVGIINNPMNYVDEYNKIILLVPIFLIKTKSV